RSKRCLPRYAGALPFLVVVATTTTASAQPPRQSPAPLSEVARGAAAIADIASHRYPYQTIRRLIRSRLEQNVQQHRDSDGFRLGAQLAAGLWIDQLPRDVPWRETELAAHRDVVRWLVPRVGLSIDEVARTVAHAEGLPPEGEQQLRRFLQAAIR